MNGLIRVGCIVLLGATGAGARTVLDAEPRTWEFQEGRWSEVATTQPSDVVTDPLLLRAEELINSNNAGAAISLLIPWLQSNPNTPGRDRGLYLMAEALFRKGDRIKAFYYLDELMDFYPDSRLFYASLEKQYQIADEFLSGYKMNVLFLPIIDGEEEAIEMLFRIQQRSPGSPLAEKALLRSAQFYMERGDYDLASDAYGAYIRSYPRSPDIAEIRMKRAFANVSQFRGLKFDSGPMIDAKAQFMEVALQHPETAQQYDIPAIVAEIDTTFARKMLETADFYRRTGKSRGAAYTYEQVVKRFPNTPEAQVAQEQLARLPGYETPKPAEEPAADGVQPPAPAGPEVPQPAEPGPVDDPGPVDPDPSPANPGSH
jgi:outer membrane assembly lipoprotein YfiO